MDSGVAAGTTIGSSFDPMLAKIISWAPTRHQAASRLAAALSGAHLHGVVTNRDLLVNVLRHPAFGRGETDTAFFDRHGLDALAASRCEPAGVRLSTLAAALAVDAAARAAAPVLAGVPSGWRNVVSQPQRVTFDRGDIGYRITRAGLVADGFDDLALVSADPTTVVLDAGGVRRIFAVAVDSDRVHVDSPLGAITLRRMPRFAEPGATIAAGSLQAPMPGTIARVAVAVG